MTNQDKFRAEAEEFEGLIEWIEDGYQPHCNPSKGKEEVFNALAKFAQDVDKRAREEIVSMVRRMEIPRDWCDNDKCEQEIASKIEATIQEG